MLSFVELLMLFQYQTRISQLEQLQQENIRLRQATGTNNNPGQRFSHNRPQSFHDSASFESGEFKNVNGKRPMVPPQGFR